MPSLVKKTVILFPIISGNQIASSNSKVAATQLANKATMPKSNTKQAIDTIVLHAKFGEDSNDSFLYN